MCGVFLMVASGMLVICGFVLLGVGAASASGMEIVGISLICPGVMLMVVGILFCVRSYKRATYFRETAFGTHSSPVISGSRPAIYTSGSMPPPPGTIGGYYPQSGSSAYSIQQPNMEGYHPYPVAQPVRQQPMPNPGSEPPPQYPAEAFFPPSQQRPQMCGVEDLPQSQGLPPSYDSVMNNFY